MSLTLRHITEAELNGVLFVKFPLGVSLAESRRIVERVITATFHPLFDGDEPEITPASLYAAVRKLETASAAPKDDCRASREARLEIRHGMRFASSFAGDHAFLSNL